MDSSVLYSSSVCHSYTPSFNLKDKVLRRSVEVATESGRSRIGNDKRMVRHNKS